MVQLLSRSRQWLLILPIQIFFRPFASKTWTCEGPCAVPILLQARIIL